MTAYSTAWGVPDPFITAADLADTPCGKQWGVEDAADLAALERAVQGASELLYVLSGRTIRGLTTETVRPTKPGMEDCCLTYRCRTKSIGLNFPIDDVEWVRLDGVEIDDWYITDNRELRRGRDVEGRPQSWPDGQRLDLDSTEEGTFAVRYRWGVELPSWATAAAYELGCALLEAEIAGQCDRLPDGVTAFTRQGVSYNITSIAERLRTGMTEATLPETTRFLALVNPGQQAHQTFAYSPDVHRLYRVTSPAEGS